MSFRKKARAVITPSVIARSRARVADISSDDKTKDDGRKSLDIKNETCDASCDDSGGPKAASDESKHIEDVAKKLTQEPRDLSSSNNPSTSTPILGKRFKRARPTPILTGRSVLKKISEPITDKVKLEEISSITDHHSRNSFRAKESEIDLTCNLVTEASLEQLDNYKIKQESDDQPVAPLSNGQEFEIDNKVNHLDYSLPSDDQDGSSQAQISDNTDHKSSERFMQVSRESENIDENPTGFVVTESRITEDIVLVEHEKIDQKNENRASGSAFRVEQQNYENPNKDILNTGKVMTEVKTENVDESNAETSNLKTLPVGSRFKRRRPVPSFGTLRPSKTNEIVSERTNLLESGTKASENKSFMKSEADTHITESDKTPEENCKNNVKKLTSSKLKPRFTPNLSRVNRTKTENDESASCDQRTASTDVKVAATLSFEDTSLIKHEGEAEADVTENQKQQKGVKSITSLDDENVHKVENEEETVSSFTKPANTSGFLSNLTSSGTRDLPDSEIKNGAEEAIHLTEEVNLSEKHKRTKSGEGKAEVIKTPRRSRFKPNIVSKSNRNDTTKTTSAKSTSFEVDKESCSTEEDISKDETDFEKFSERKVRFMPDNNKEFSKSEESGSYCEEDNELGDNEQRVNPAKAPYSYSRSHSDTEDGSQSEGEGIHHHSKRKFAPFLGPSVRQRRRLSSMTMSEDEGLMSDKNMTEKAKSSSEVSEGGLAINKALEIVIENDAKAVSRAEPKKQKRKRIIINEPKEKMTMFDYIYYNPKGTEEERAEREAEKEQENKRQKRLHDESTRVDESEIVLGSVNDDDTMNSISSAADNETKMEVGASSSVDGDKDDNDDDNDDIIAPQIKIGEDGQIIIDEQSLTLKTTRSKMSLEGSEIVYNDDFDPYWRRNEPKRKKRWPVEDTLKFYRVLGRVGTDFSLMTQFFPDCTRRVLKKKFKTEEKFNGDLIDRALRNMLPMDEALFAELQQSKEKIVYDKNTFTGAQRGRKAAIRAKKKEQNTEEQEIVREEIMNMEVAENVTL